MNIQSPGEGKVGRKLSDWETIQDEIFGWTKKIERVFGIKTYLGRVRSRVPCSSRTH